MTMRAVANQGAQLERALRRHGIEGEAAFRLLTARYLIQLDDRQEQLSERFVERTTRSFSVVIHAEELRLLLDEVVASDPSGSRLADWYQYFVGRRFREGTGKFFTPRPVAEAMVGLLPRTDQAVILDPACGGGSFLLAASKCWGKTRCHLVGNEIESSLVDLTEVALALAAPTHHLRSVIETNLFESHPSLKAWNGKVDYILANPPFSLPLGTINMGSRLFSLGYRTSDAVFLDICFELLCSGGRLVCLLPHSLIVNAEFQKLRAAVEEIWQLRGIITLPEGLFHLSASTTTRADILILDKPAAGGPTRNHKVIFANAPTAGLPLNRRMKDASNALAEIVARGDVAKALDLNRE